MGLVEATWVGSAGAVRNLSIVECGAAPGGASRFATPVADANGHLKLIVWEMDGDQVHRRGDSGTLSPALPVDLIAACGSPDDGGLAVTAVRDTPSGALRVLFWALGEAHGGALHPVIAFDVPHPDGGHAVDAVSVSRCAAGIVTASLRDDHRLAFAVWDYVAFSPIAHTTLGPHLLKESTKAIDGTKLAVAGWADGIVTAIRDRASGELHLHAWTIGADGSIAKKGTATAGKVDDVAATSISGDRVITVVKQTTSGELEAIVWDLEQGGATITRRGSIVAPKPAEVLDGLAVCNLGEDVLIDTVIAPTQVAAAAHEPSGNLKITLWDVDEHGRLFRTDDRAFDRVEAIAMMFAGTKTIGTTGGQKTTETRALLAARRADGDLGLFAIGSARDDVLPDVPAWASLDFKMQHQLESKWCWAATSTSVTLFYDPASDWTQCKLANKVKGRSDCCGSGASGPCNKGDSSSTALTVTGHFSRAEWGPAGYDNVAAEIAGGCPVVVRTAWSGGGAHAIAITGYDREEEQFLTVQDPIYGHSVYTYDTFKTAYRHSGTWSLSDFTRP